MRHINLRAALQVAVGNGLLFGFALAIRNPAPALFVLGVDLIAIGVHLNNIWNSKS